MSTASVASLRRGGQHQWISGQLRPEWVDNFTGIRSKVAVAWLQWMLKGDKTAEKMFMGPSCGLCKDTNWKFEKKKME